MCSLSHNNNDRLGTHQVDSFQEFNKVAVSDVRVAWEDYCEDTECNVSHLSRYDDRLILFVKIMNRSQGPSRPDRQ